MTAKPRKVRELKIQSKENGTSSDMMISVMCRKMGVISQV